MTAEILAPYTYLAKNPGKNFRDLLVNSVAECLGAKGVAATVRNCINRLHVASMLIDDVEDGATTRRGQPAAHTIYGSALTINCSHFVVFETMSQLDTILHPIFIEEVMALHQGQGQDIYWRDQHICPSEDEYIEMVKNKTGGLLRMALRMLWELSPKNISEEILAKLANTLGILYQIQDDYLNLKSDEYQTSKGFCEDLSEGKYSFPVIYCIHHAPIPVARELQQILRLKTSDASVKQRALQLLETTKSFDYCRDRILEYHGEVAAMVCSLPNSEMLRQVIDRIVLV